MKLAQLTCSTLRNAAFALLIVLAATVSPADESNQPKATSMNQTQKVVALLKSIETGDPKPVAAINPHQYLQHNLGAGDGLAGFGALLQALPQGSAKVNTVRAFSDGDYVVAHTDYNFFGPKIGFDIFRFENGLIVEHWDNLQEKPITPNPTARFSLSDLVASGIES